MTGNDVKVEIWGLDAILDAAYEGALWCVFIFFLPILTCGLTRLKSLCSGIRVAPIRRIGT